MNALADVLARPRARATWWFAAAIVLVAANLRPAVVGLAPVLPEIQRSVGLSATASGVLTALPVLCFGLLAPAAPRLARRFGIGRTLLGALVLICLGIALRSSGPTATLFAGTVLVGSAIALGNVLPGLIKRDFPHRTGSMTGIYSMAISAGGALAAGTTVPVARALGVDWRGALALWGAFALVALLCWLPHVRWVDRARGVREAHVRPLWRSPLAWQVTAFMGLQSLGFYATSAWLPAIFVDRGFDPATAGWLLAFASVTGLSGSMAAPVLATRLRRQRAVAAGLTAVAALGLLGVLLLPGAEVVSMAVLGVGQGAALGLSLTLMVLRSPDAAHAAQLSGMAQCVGYVGAAAGPFAVGALHDLTGSWTVPILLLLGVFVVQATMGVLAGRDRLVAADVPASTG
ncbi:CynX/NimT family MFS transporter [Pseudonocardia kunmingensis]|uniref:CP family cyanate transporter-like MFS transporter n=1 Tax=Pseudonocardia kunmingensis TaxID=630975 RepID=A0A543D3B2_9PSEU|nr:MFS transporter [Pseudonocardia kunmingensis]TQM03830.1 CP family cyanate transporter-like MFS transporter [Pseudonocardia kunmingensis]